MRGSVRPEDGRKEIRNLSDRRRRWGIILAGGDGVRLRSLTRFISGDDRPKQFCRLYGGMTLLDKPGGGLGARCATSRSFSP